jgi:dTDP-glucose 4,6-dehydratase
MRSDIGYCDYFLHLAAISDVQFSVENPVYSIKNNVDSTLVMLELARELKPEVFVQFSTDEIYGPVSDINSPHAEWDTHRPSNPYSASKAATEDIAYAYWRTYDVPVIITNTMNNFAEAQSASKFPAIVQRKLMNDAVVEIHGNDQEIGSRFYIHSRNVADALLFILERGAAHHQPGALDEPHKYHIVGDQQLNNLELAQMIAGFMGKELKYELIDFHRDNPGHDIHYGMSDNKLWKLGWSAPHSLEQSMKNTIEWQLRNPKWIT